MQIRRGKDWAGLKVGILGLGRSGRAAAALLSGLDAEVLGFDDRPAREIEEFSGTFRPVGQGLPDDLVALVVSPGVAPRHPLLLEAEANGVETLGEMELGFRELRGKCIAVTGTNGKSTVVSLIESMLRACGLNAHACGNIGIPLCELAGELDASSVAVVEASSFQLERIRAFHPRTAAILNVAPDHLDRYADFEAYRRAKLNLLDGMGAGDRIVLPEGDVALDRHVASSAAEIMHFGIGVADEPSASLEEGWLVLREKGKAMPILERSELPLLGAHNVENALAALACASPFVDDPRSLAEGLRTFEALAHRCELVLEKDGIRWVDDSKATNVHAALHAVGGSRTPVIWLLGGSGKGEDYRPLRHGADRARLAICYGKEGPAIEEALGDALPTRRASGLIAALELAATELREGDTVLLSPACASFDEFGGFAARGDAFIQWVHSHAGDRG